MCSRHEQLPHVIVVGPQWATTHVRQKATVVCEVRGSRSNECHDEVQCIATAMCGAADMLHHVERRQHITETTTVRVSCQLKSDIKVPANHNRACIDDQCL